jgi:hypothetical protein
MEQAQMCRKEPTVADLYTYEIVYERADGTHAKTCDNHLRIGSIGNALALHVQALLAMPEVVAIFAAHIYEGDFCDILTVPSTVGG